MPVRGKARARRRNEARAKRNALALETIAEIAVAPPKLEKARTRTRLEELHARGVISIEQRHAGDRLVSDYRRSGEQLARLVANYAPWAPKGTGRQINDAQPQVDARRRYELPMHAVGRWLSPILVHVCICDLTPGDWCGDRGYPPRDGAGILRLALDALATHYGMRSWPQAA
jgi:hypothetical protein